MSEDGLAKIGEAFFEIERRENLYDWKVGGISLWVLMNRESSALEGPK